MFKIFLRIFQLSSDTSNHLLCRNLYTLINKWNLCFYCTYNDFQYITIT